MHIMPDSAPSLRDARRDETTRALVRAARRRTAASGLSGFTVEELCADVGVSRRTFFNYFASKEDAVLSFPLHRTDAGAQERFVAGGTTGPVGGGTGISPTLLDDLSALAEARWRAMDFDPESFAELTEAVEREPRLTRRVFELVQAGEAADARLIAEREHLAEDDLLAVSAAQILATVSRATAGEFLFSGNPDSFVAIFERRMTALRTLFLSQTTPNGPA